MYLNSPPTLHAQKHPKGCPWDEATCTSAIYEGHLNTLRYARENDCPWDPKACRFAAEMGHLEVLAWCKANGAHLDARICISAAGNGHLEVCTHVQEHGAFAQLLRVGTAVVEGTRLTLPVSTSASSHVYM